MFQTQQIISFITHARACQDWLHGSYQTVDAQKSPSHVSNRLVTFQESVPLLRII